MKSLRGFGALVAVVVGLTYILNPTGGVFELLPDVLPVVGNLDEAAATALLLAGLKGLRRPTGVVGPEV